MGPIDARHLLIEDLDQDQQEDPIYILGFNKYQMNKIRSYFGKEII